MKKGKELLGFLIPFVLLNVWSVVGPLLWSMAALTGDTTPQFVGSEHYLRLLLNDRLFWIGIGNTLLLTCLTGVVVGAVSGSLVLLLRRWLSLPRPWWYVAVFAVATLLTLGLWVAKVRTAPNGYNWVYFVQTGNAAAFMVWLAELVIQAIKERKKEDQ